MQKHFSHFTDTLKFTVKISYGKDAKNKWDFSLVLKVCMELFTQRMFTFNPSFITSYFSSRCIIVSLLWHCHYAAGLLTSFDVARHIERLESPEVRALGPPKHRQQVIILFQFLSGFCDDGLSLWYQLVIIYVVCLLYTSPSPRD